MNDGRVIVIGASHAGAQLCANLRQRGWAGRILLIGDEPVLPYQRPPLSKTFLSGAAPLRDLLIRPPEFYDQRHIDVRHARVTAIDVTTRHVTLSDGATIGYDELALCTGARPRRLDIPGTDLAGVHYLRTVADVTAIRSALAGRRRVVVIGGGYLGLEIAASMRALGLDVVVVETARRVLHRVTAAPVSAFHARIHREEGVDLRTGVTTTAIEGDGDVRGVRLSDGAFLAADLVVIGVGVQPNTELAESAGLAVRDGIVVDARGRTSDPHIVAAGDCANHGCPHYGRRVRLESVPNAAEHARVAAATLCGEEKTISALPWFWSDQYDLKLQIAGLNEGHDDVVLRGDPDTGRGFSCFYFQQERLIAADCVNRPQDFVFSRKVIGERLPLDRRRLANSELPITALLAR